MASPRGRAGECRAKGAIYGGDDRPMTPEHHGKKMVAGASGAGGVPFATYVAGPGASPLEGFPADFHLIGKAKGFSDKVGTQAIDASIYKESYDEKHAIDVASRVRNAGGAPYAADWAPPGGASAYPSEFVLPARDREREPTGKVGALAAFDPSVYAGQRAANQAVSEAVARKLGSSGAPFATSTGFDELRRRDYYHPKQKKVDGAADGKPWSQPDFDAGAYAAQLRTNQDLQEESAHKKFVGSGNVLGWSS
ncbi:hypothetical protein Rsub_01276 [Raphidocelis subcapitata]|uniref:Uncharacterized protein n=1 Tax=Raphidocelis subcapitata TaxID=307507 RepID=A0A2V0NM63_9CHLO|nr:hypothetical protein Rsub_01276 [Raphidocelis subcapitata]|eukprot:GBF88561.1 hypothetical protein Rsub_01276 [Raphidocelis subcapitata]